MTNANQQSSDSDDVIRKGHKVDYSNKAIELRLSLVWQLTIEEWAKKGIDVANQPMRKDVERLIRLSDKQ